MVNIEHLKFSACAYFYKLKDGNTISSKEVRKMLIDVTSSKIHNYLFNEYRVEKDNGLKYSMRVFKDKPRMPKFIDTFDKQWQEQKIGYYLFIEYDNYIAILKKNCTIPNVIFSKLENIGYKNLITLFTTSNTKINKMSMQNLFGSDNAVRYKSYEALNLKDNLSPIGTSHYYIRSFKGDNDKNKFALALALSRINNCAGDYTLENICHWVKEIIEKIKANGKNLSNFLEMFAEPVKYSNLKEKLQPSALLVFYGLIETLRNEHGASFYKETENGKAKINDDDFQEILTTIQTCFDTIRRDDKDNKRYFTGKDESIEIILLKSEIRLLNKKWDQIIIEDSPDHKFDGTLTSIINKNSLFNVYFTDPQLIYSNHTLFKDTRLLSSAHHFMGVMHSKLKGEFQCEKYIEDSPRDLNDWNKQSIFKYVEMKFASKYTHFICEDCGTEWADHIGISSGRVTFFVEKHRKSKNSASDFQDVVGQALKNLANLIPSKEQLTSKQERWERKYQTSNIPRYRSKQGTVADAIKVWVENNQKPNCKREMCLVVDFLDRKEFRKQLNELLNGKSLVKKEELRMRLWLLSSFVNTCLEYGVSPLIYCK